MTKCGKAICLFCFGTLCGTSIRAFAVSVWYITSIVSHVDLMKDYEVFVRRTGRSEFKDPMLENTTVLNVGLEHFFWWKGQKKLCDLIRETKGITNLVEGRTKGPHIIVNMTIDCTLSFNELGTGNYMIALYEAIMATSYSGVDFAFQCSQGSKDHHVMKWFEGCYPANRDNWMPYNLTEQLVCSWSSTDIPLDMMGNEIQKGVRTFVQRAIGIYGQPPLSTEIDTPAFGKTVFDETAIHFHCDSLLMLQRPRRDYGIIKFKEYRKFISQDTKTIGLIPQPFELNGNRPGDENRTENCKKVVRSLLEYLQRDFPNAKISIRDKEQDTLPLAYVRLTVAKQSFMGLSSLPSFPFIASYGEAFFQEGTGHVNVWLNRLSESMSMKHLKMRSMDFVTNIRGVDVMLSSLNE